MKTAVRTGNQCLVKFFVAATFTGAGHMLGTDLETRVKSAVGSKCFCIRESSGGDDIG